MSVVIGIDLTFKGGLGLCALPEDWDLDWKRVVVEEVAAAGDTGRDLAEISFRAAEFCEAHDGSSVWIEQPIAGARAFHAVKLAGLGGALRAELWNALGLESTLVPVPSARKLCFGRVPRFPKGDPLHGKTKQVLHDELRKMGAPSWWGSDALDAWVVANYGSASIGGCCIAMPPPEKPKRGKRRAA